MTTSAPVRKRPRGSARTISSGAELVGGGDCLGQEVPVAALERRGDARGLGGPAGVDEIGLDQAEAAHALAVGRRDGGGEGLDNADEPELVATVLQRSTATRTASAKCGV